MREIDRRKPFERDERDAMHQFWSAALARFEEYMANHGRLDAPSGETQSFKSSQKE
jgi:hypothetical protein